MKISRQKVSRDFEHAQDGYKERITVEYDPTEPFAVITKSVKGPNEKRFKHVESVAIPTPLVSKVCFALGATEWEQ